MGRIEEGYKEDMVKMKINRMTAGEHFGSERR